MQNQNSAPYGNSKYLNTGLYAFGLQPLKHQADNVVGKFLLKHIKFLTKFDLKLIFLCYANKNLHITFHYEIVFAST